MKSRISLFILLCLLGSVSQAGGEDGFPKVMFASAFDSLLAGNGDGFPMRVQFVNVDEEGNVYFQIQKVGSPQNLRVSETTLTNANPEILDALERSFNDNNSWQEI